MSDLSLPGFNTNDFKPEWLNYLPNNLNYANTNAFQWGLDNPQSATPYTSSSPVAGKWWDQLGSSMDWKGIGSNVTSSLLNRWMNPMPNASNLGQVFGGLASAGSTVSAANLTTTGPFTRMVNDLNREALAKEQADNKLYTKMGTEMANYLEAIGRKTDTARSVHAHGGDPFAGFRPRNKVIAGGYSNMTSPYPSSAFNMALPPPISKA